MKTNMNIAFCINDSYASYVAVTIKSIIENNDAEKLTIHILTDGMSDRKQQIIYDVIPASNVHIYEIDDGKLKRLKDTWSIYTWYRVLLPEILPNEIKTVLYLDADIIVEDDISSLFKLNMKGKTVAGVIDVQSLNKDTYVRCHYEPEKKYICAGVLVMNLEYWREHNLCDKIIDWGLAHNTEIHFPDQDTINYICQDTKIVLDMRYGVLDAFFHDGHFFQEPYKHQLLEALEHPAIIHYAGQSPWIIERTYHQFQSRWDYYNSLLPKPNKKIHYPQGLRLMYYHIRIMLDKMGIVPFKLWHVSDSISDDEIRQRLLKSV